jgi:hypothetical protein
MQLWILQPQLSVLEREAHPWTPPFDKTLGVLVRAGSEVEARQLAQSKAGNEGQGVYSRLGLAEDEMAEEVWLKPEWTSCDQLTAEGKSEVIMVVRHGA